MWVAVPVPVHSSHVLPMITEVAVPREAPVSPPSQNISANAQCPVLITQANKSRIAEKARFTGGEDTFRADVCQLGKQA
jgi:hypothetical protein